MFLLAHNIISELNYLTFTFHHLLLSENIMQSKSNINLIIFENFETCVKDNNYYLKVYYNYRIIFLFYIIPIYVEI